MEKCHLEKLNRVVHAVLYGCCAVLLCVLLCCRVRVCVWVALWSLWFPSQVSPLAVNRLNIEMEGHRTHSALIAMI